MLRTDLSKVEAKTEAPTASTPTPGRYDYLQTYFVKVVNEDKDQLFLTSGGTKIILTTEGPTSAPTPGVPPKLFDPKKANLIMADKLTLCASIDKASVVRADIDPNYKRTYCYKNRTRLSLTTPPKTPEEFTQLAFALSIERSYYGVRRENLLPCSSSIFSIEEIKKNKFYTQVALIDTKDGLPLIMNLLNDAAAAGDGKAQIWLNYLQNTPVVSDNHAKAKQWIDQFQRAAKAAIDSGLTALPKTSGGMFRSGAAATSAGGSAAATVASEGEVTASAAAASAGPVLRS